MMMGVKLFFDVIIKFNKIMYYVVELCVLVMVCILGEGF